MGVRKYTLYVPHQFWNGYSTRASSDSQKTTTGAKLLFLCYCGVFKLLGTSATLPTTLRNSVRMYLFRESSTQLAVSKERVADSFILGLDAAPLPLSTSLVDDHDHVHHLSSTVESTLASLPYDNLHFRSCVGGAFDDDS